MAFSDDYTDSESETDESTSVDSEAHSSDLDFLNDESESEESEVGDSEDDDVELVLENVVSGAIIVGAGEPVQQVSNQPVEATEVAVELLVEVPEVAVEAVEVLVETVEVSSETLEKPQCTDAMQVDNAAVNPEAV